MTNKEMEKRIVELEKQVADINRARLQWPVPWGDPSVTSVPSSFKPCRSITIGPDLTAAE